MRWQDSQAQDVSPGDVSWYPPPFKCHLCHLSQKKGVATQKSKQKWTDHCGRWLREKLGSLTRACTWGGKGTSASHWDTCTYVSERFIPAVYLFYYDTWPIMHQLLDEQRGKRLNWLDFMYQQLFTHNPNLHKIIATMCAEEKKLCIKACVCKLHPCSICRCIADCLLSVFNEIFWPLICTKQTKPFISPEKRNSKSFIQAWTIIFTSRCCLQPGCLNEISAFCFSSNHKYES